MKEEKNEIPEKPRKNGYGNKHFLFFGSYSSFHSGNFSSLVDCPIKPDEQRGIIRVASVVVSEKVALFKLPGGIKELSFLALL
jgi:hypothetical protein